MGYKLVTVFRNVTTDGGIVDLLGEVLTVGIGRFVLLKFVLGFAHPPGEATTALRHEAGNVLGIFDAGDVGLCDPWQRHELGDEISCRP
ncbi:MAG: hypothetical protein WDN31_18775 [Hyphomicrobium sp.]